MGSHRQALGHRQHCQHACPYQQHVDAIRAALNDRPGCGAATRLLTDGRTAIARLASGVKRDRIHDKLYYQVA